MFHWLFVNGQGWYGIMSIIALVYMYAWSLFVGIQFFVFNTLSTFPEHKVKKVLYFSINIYRRKNVCITMN